MHSVITHKEDVYTQLDKDQTGRKQVWQHKAASCICLYLIIITIFFTELNTTPEIEETVSPDLKALYIPESHIFDLKLIAQGIVAYLDLTAECKAPWCNDT